jgi:hypothetical protein
MMDKQNPGWKFMPDGKSNYEEFVDKLQDDLPKVVTFIDKGKRL